MYTRPMASMSATLNGLPAVHGGACTSTTTSPSSPWANSAGFICTDGLKFTCLMRADGSQVHVNADVWPDGGTALFVGVMPVLPPELR